MVCELWATSAGKPERLKKKKKSLQTLSSSLSSCAGAMSALRSPLRIGALSPVCYIQSVLCKLTKLSTFIPQKLYIGFVFLLEEMLKQPCLLLKICSQETGNEICRYVFLEHRFRLHLVQEIRGLVIWLLIHNGWCVGAEREENRCFHPLLQQWVSVSLLCRRIP